MEGSVKGVPPAKPVMKRIVFSNISFSTPSNQRYAPSYKNAVSAVHMTGEFTNQDSRNFETVLIITNSALLTR